MNNLNKKWITPLLLSLHRVYNYTAAILYSPRKNGGNNKIWEFSFRTHDQQIHVSLEKM